MKIDKFFILTLIYVISLVSVVLVFNKKILKLKKSSFNTKKNKILRDILDSCISKDLEASASSIIKILKCNYKIDYCTVLINKEKLIAVASNESSEYIKQIEDHCNRLICKVNGRTKVNYSPDGYLNYNSARQRFIKYSCLVPLRQNNELLGAIYIENKDYYKENSSSSFVKAEKNSFEIEFTDMVVKNITIALQNCLYHDEIKNLAMKDNLTKIYNRNYFHIHLNQQIQLKKPFALAMFDIDHFRDFNNNYGHETGDLVLFHVAQFIKKNIRESDKIYRWGGEEFIIFFYNTSGKEIYEMLDKVRQTLSEITFIDEKGNVINETSVTASFGIADFSKHAQNIEELRECADRALYYSKNTGRNKITLYDEI